MATRDRLESEKNVCVATVRPDGRPHLVPVWFVVEGDAWYICTGPASVKARNLQRNAHIALALEDGNDPLVVEGQARAVAPAPRVVQRFKQKYDWDITTDETYSQVYQVVVQKKLLGT